ncbi:L-rhamnose mutarotase [Carnobacterium sp. 17-4]|uniref:L-rhamnose mutarotase n=1 Tax=Carnobacterium sp. (strain 17-4) TaxID=208596 RepID=UPI0002059374|nr:L-rhamnose mutarotase [Carnobacterium sp. 17-4]AEB31016.1 L-rhamnose mutarotase [Carnobacterium sp. 17-4]
MLKKGFKMKIYPDKQKEYEKRHGQLWPEMRQMLKEHGAISYSIFIDPETDYLFGYLEIEDENKWTGTAETEINQKWWNYMKDIMETNLDNSPVTIDLKQVFEL